MELLASNLLLQFQHSIAVQKNWVTFCHHIFIIHKFVMSIVISGPLLVERGREREREIDSKSEYRLGSGHSSKMYS